MKDIGNVLQLSKTIHGSILEKHQPRVKPNAIIPADPISFDMGGILQRILEGEKQRITTNSPNPKGDNVVEKDTWLSIVLHPYEGIIYIKSNIIKLRDVGNEEDMYEVSQSIHFGKKETVASANIYHLPYIKFTRYNDGDCVIISHLKRDKPDIIQNYVITDETQIKDSINNFINSDIDIPFVQMYSSLKFKSYFIESKEINNIFVEQRNNISFDNYFKIINDLLLFRNDDMNPIIAQRDLWRKYVGTKLMKAEEIEEEEKRARLFASKVTTLLEELADILPPPELFDPPRPYIPSSYTALIVNIVTEFNKNNTASTTEYVEEFTKEMNSLSITNENHKEYANKIKDIVIKIIHKIVDELKIPTFRDVVEYTQVVMGVIDKIQESSYVPPPPLGGKAKKSKKHTKINKQVLWPKKKTPMWSF